MRANRSFLVIAIASAAAAARASEPPQPVLDVEGAMAFAAEHHPSERADAENVRAQAAQVDVERARYTPDVELFVQLDRATTNAVPGSYFAVPGLPAITGAVGRNLDSGHWGTEIGASVSWDALGYHKWNAATDLSRAKAELAFAKTALARAEAASVTASVALDEALGAPGAHVATTIGRLAAAPPAAIARTAARDPRVIAADDRVRVAETERRVIESAAWPKLLLVGAIFARGSDQLPGANADGLVPVAPNWALGALLTWPVLADRTIAPAKRAQTARIARERARAEVIEQQVTARRERARAVLAGALKVAAETPAALQAARDAEAQIVARFKAQLATADDVAQTERLLVQAETDDAIARLDVWRALLLVAYATGDLAPFVAAYRGAA